MCQELTGGTTVGTMSYMYVLWTVASGHKCGTRFVVR